MASPGPNIWPSCLSYSFSTLNRILFCASLLKFLLRLAPITSQEERTVVVIGAFVLYRKIERVSAFISPSLSLGWRHLNSGRE